MGDEVPLLVLELEGKQEHESLEFGGLNYLGVPQFPHQPNLGVNVYMDIQ